MKAPLLFAALLTATVCFAQDEAKTFIVKASHPFRTTIAETVVKTGSIQSPAVVDILSKVGGRLISTTLTNGTEVVEGTHVTKGDVIARVDSRDYEANLAAAEARLAYAKASLTDAQKEFDRTTALLKDNTATEQEADKASADLQRAKASLQEAQASLELAKINVEETFIRAPMAGVISAKKVYPGAMLSAATAIYTLTEIDNLRLFFDLPTTLFANVQPGLTDITITVDAYPSEKLPLKLFSVHPVANQDTRTVRLEVHLANPQTKYLPGMYVKGEIALNKRDNVLVVPYDALTRIVDKTIVYKIQDGRAVTTEVKTGTRFDDLYEVVEGLTEDDLIVTTGQHRLTNGVSVKIEGEKGIPTQTNRNK